MTQPNGRTISTLQASQILNYLHSLASLAWSVNHIIVTEEPNGVSKIDVLNQVELIRDQAQDLVNFVQSIPDTLEGT